MKSERSCGLESKRRFHQTSISFTSRGIDYMHIIRDSEKHKMIMRDENCRHIRIMPIYIFVKFFSENTLFILIGAQIKAWRSSLNHVMYGKWWGMFFYGQVLIKIKNRDICNFFLVWIIVKLIDRGIVKFKFMLKNYNENYVRINNFIELK